MFRINEYLYTPPGAPARPTVLQALKCADGFTMSVQASEIHYCSPRESGLNHYDSVEVGFPSQREESLMEYADDPENPIVYGWVPVEVVDAIINAHGGLKKDYFAEAMQEVEKFLNE